MILSVASQKGGVGKTTTSISLAAGLARKGQRVLLIDTDSQANASKVLLSDYTKLRPEDTLHATMLERKPLPVFSTGLDNLDLVPSHILLSNTDIELTTAKDHREARLKRQLDPIAHQYDHVIIDCPPALSWLTLNAFNASERVLVVVAPGYFELDSTIQIGKTIAEVKENFNPQLELAGFLFTMSDPTRNAATSLKLLRQTYGNQVFETVIPRNAEMKSAHMSQKDIFSHSPKASSALAYNTFIKEFFGL